MKNFGVPVLTIHDLENLLDLNIQRVNGVDGRENTKEISCVHVYYDLPEIDLSRQRVEEQAQPQQTETLSPEQKEQFNAFAMKALRRMNVETFATDIYHAYASWHSQQEEYDRLWSKTVFYRYLKAYPHQFAFKSQGQGNRSYVLGLGIKENWQND